MIFQNSVIIIGGGPAGLASAKKVLEMGYRVVLLERMNSLSQIRARGNPFKRFAGDISGLGGTTNAAWGAQMALMDNEILRLWCEKMEVSEAYISEFKRASKELSGWLECPEILDNFDSQAISADLIDMKRSNQFSVILKNNNLLYYFQEVIHSENFRVIDFDVSRIEWEADTFSLVSVSNEIIKCVDSKLIIASGCIGSTEIIVNSHFEKKIDKSQLRSVRDHPNAILFEFKLPIARALLLGSRLKNQMKAKFVIKDYAKDLDTFRYCAFEVVPMRCQSVLWDSNTQVEHNHTRVCKFLNVLDKVIALLSSNKLSIRNRYLVWATLEMLESNELDSPFGSDGAWKNFSINNNTLDSFQRISEAIQMKISNFGGSITNQANIYAAWNRNPSSFESGHPSGTMPCGENPKKAFFNSFGISHFDSRLLVISTSSFPRDSWQNPTFTLMTLAIVGVQKLLSGQNDLERDDTQKT